MSLTKDLSKIGSIANALYSSITANTTAITSINAAVVDINTGANIASASTINLNTATGNRVHITGTTAITAVTLTRGPRTVIFDGVLTLTHHATTNNLPGAANITTAAGDRAIYESDGTTVFCVNYTKATGVATVVGPIVPTVILSARTTNTILGAADQGTLIDITSGTFSQTFTAAATLGSGWYVYLRNNGTGDITLDPNASELIDGLATYVMYQGETRLIQCTGTAFTSVVLSPFYRVFTASGTYTQPPGYTAVGTRVIGASGGGGSGRRGLAATNRGGGAGGGGGALASQIISGLTAGTGYAITIGAGGAGGAAVTVDTTNGNDGTVGGTSSFATLLYAYGGGGGGGGGASAGNSPGTGGGTGSAGTTAGQWGGDPRPTADMTSAGAALNAVGGGGAGVVGNGDSGNAEYGGGGGGKNDAATTIRAGGSSLYGGPGGGSGGTITNANVVKVGGAGGAVNSYTPGGGGAGGAATGATGSAGAAGANGFCGTGGGGGGSGTGVGGTGGAGGAPGGGAGGGAASVNTFNSGAGGSGARGEVQVWGVA